ncbi:MAG: cytochrome c biogenesis protein CcdA [Planctomycetota bacterium]
MMTDPNFPPSIGLAFSRLIMPMLMLVALSPVLSAGQESADQSDASPAYFLKNELQPGDASTQPSSDEVTLASKFKLKTGTRKGILQVKATIKDGWHTFSITQAPGGPLVSKLTVAESEDYTAGKFAADREPHKSMSDEFKMMVEEHEGEVIWTAPIELSDTADIKNLKIKIIYNGGACESKKGGRCVPIFDVETIAKFDGYDEKIKLPQMPKKLKLIPFEPDALHTTAVGKVYKAKGTGPIRPGDALKLEITAEAYDDYHVYAYGLPADGPYNLTFIRFENRDDWKLVGPVASEEPEFDEELEDPVFYHHEVTWSFDLVAPKNVKQLKGQIKLQTCDVNGCDPPMDIDFTVDIPVGIGNAEAIKFVEAKAEAGEKFKSATPVDGEDSNSSDTKFDSPIDSDPGKVIKLETPSTVVTPEIIAEMASLYDVTDPIKYLTFEDMKTTPIGAGVTSKASDVTLSIAFFGMFLGGMLLNLMPCVFPVLGIKVLGFVKLGGEDDAKVRMHGIVFGLGLIVSMWVLAGTLLLIKFFTNDEINWGAQMGNPYFVGIMILFLFLLGLNMAGVFEVGTSLSSVGGKATSGGGYFSSFLSGVLTTLIATPCSGPFLGSAMAVAFGKGQSPVITMLLFTVFGLGIAFPYVILAFFPPLIKSLPKPGPWMDTFKVTMAFALFATVAFFMQSFGVQTGPQGLSWLVMALVIVGLAAYLFGQFGEPDYKTGRRRWIVGYILPGLIAGLGFWMTYDAAAEGDYLADTMETRQSEGDWYWAKWYPGMVEYSLAKKKRIVWVDYTADW